MMNERFELNEMELEEVIGGSLWTCMKSGATKIANAAKEFSFEDFYQDHVFKPVNPEDIDDLDKMSFRPYDL